MNFLKKHVQKRTLSWVPAGCLVAKLVSPEQTQKGDNCVTRLQAEMKEVTQEMLVSDKVLPKTNRQRVLWTHGTRKPRSEKTAHTSAIANAHREPDASETDHESSRHTRHDHALPKMSLR